MILARVAFTGFILLFAAFMSVWAWIVFLKRTRKGDKE
jgi:hypothetical protein